jgi:hypothetical protein
VGSEEAAGGGGGGMQNQTALLLLPSILCIARQVWFSWIRLPPDAINKNKLLRVAQNYKIMEGFVNEY